MLTRPTLLLCIGARIVRTITRFGPCVVERLGTGILDFRDGFILVSLMTGFRKSVDDGLDR
jgi:hypothetical protein